LVALNAVPLDGLAMHVLVFNPGGNSLKVEVVRCDPEQKTASQATKLIDIIVEGIGREAKLSRFSGKKVDHSEPFEAENYADAAANILQWLARRDEVPPLDEIECVGVRVVHGGDRFTQPTEITEEVSGEIMDLAKWAPLHNQRSVEILPPLRQRLPRVPIYAVFDTAFHRTIPEFAHRYAIPPDLADRHCIRRYGFHGISHRYMLDRYAYLAGRPPGEVTIVTMHLESGCSVTAISNGKSVENTMGLTPLEGLMMGTRSGDVDPALIEYLMRAENLTIEDVMELLNKKSGLLGVSGKSLDTRVLMKEYDTNGRARLAMDMFSFRVMKSVGACLAALGGAQAVVFGGGIGENTLSVRQRVCDGLRWCGLEIDEERNRTLIDVEGRISTDASAIQAWVVPVEEGLQIAHECAGAISPKTNQSQPTGSRFPASERPVY